MEKENEDNAADKILRISVKTNDNRLTTRILQFYSTYLKRLLDITWVLEDARRQLRDESAKQHHGKESFKYNMNDGSHY